jgi:hypothetical protein
MKTKSIIRIASGLFLSAILLISCGTFIKSNLVDEATLIKSWLHESGYKEKSNGFVYGRSENKDNTYTITMYRLVGNVDDAIIKGSTIASRVKQIDKNQRYECVVENHDDYYYVQCWKSFHFEEFDSSKNVMIPTWKIPYKITYYLKKNQTGKSDFIHQLMKTEEEFSMDYAGFLDDRDRKLQEYKELQMMINPDDEESEKTK